MEATKNQNYVEPRGERTLKMLSGRFNRYMKVLWDKASCLKTT